MFTQFHKAQAKYFVSAMLVLLVSVFIAQAAQNRWANSRGGGKWEIGANWSLDIPPNINHDAVIASALSETVNIDATTAALPNNMDSRATTISTAYINP
jgi:hypothetical protein